jgi:hypothetical protein
MVKEENINVKLTKEQRKLLNMLKGELGSTEAEILRNIFLTWLSEKSILQDVIKKRLKKKTK